MRHQDLDRSSERTKHGKLQRRPVAFRIALELFLIVFVSVVTANAQAPAASSQSAEKVEATATAEPQEHQVDDAKTPKAPASATLSPEEERQAQIAADAARLFQLAQELKAEVAKSNKDTLSISVVKKSEEIEKLAKSLKERMRKE